MKLIRQREELAEAIRDRIAWAHVIVGASGHPFVALSHGESIRGYESWQGGSRSWSRPLPGSRYLLWEAACADMRVIEHDRPSVSHESWLAKRRPLDERTVALLAAPRRTGAGWVEEAAEYIAGLANLHLAWVNTATAGQLLVAGEWIEVKADRDERARRYAPDAPGSPYLSEMREEVGR